MTYSIVAHDPESGQMGVAVQSHFFSVGSICPWPEPGVGVVATQAMAEVSYGPLGLALLRAGKSPDEALRALLAVDDGAARRQVAVVDAGGAVAVHTGEQCIPEAGHHEGDGYSVQANMMERPTVWDAMAEAYEAATGDLADRMLAALDAGEAEGGDIRGRQSAALVVVEATGRPWERAYDVRVDDDPDPLADLRRLLDMQRAYRTGRHGPAMGPNPELLFWEGVRLAAEEGPEAARQVLARAYEQDGRWAELLRRLPAAGLLPDDPELIRALTEGSGA